MYSNKDYDGTRPSGSSLKEFFTPAKGYQSQKMYSDQEVEFRSLCTAAPADTGTHIFTVMFLDREGDTIRLNTPPVKLLK